MLVFTNFIQTMRIPGLTISNEVCLITVFLSNIKVKIKDVRLFRLNDFEIKFLTIRTYCESCSALTSKSSIKKKNWRTKHIQIMNKAVGGILKHLCWSCKNISY